ncbi:MAG TPA: 16S rRNA (cytidine(1402)-2'-O)-methyltransferase, partial [Parachlamydiaceae bacterium]|nr:16S rRNA (cytidine(1402)-2'-O)-methyltransferase [Parachlamydiaceae bacterium]
TICYESPNRLIDVLEQIVELAPDRQLVVARELTKKFEEIKRGKATDLITYWKEAILKGEIVFMISGAPETVSQDWEALTPKEHVEFVQNTYGITRQEAIINVAKIRGVSKRDIYNVVHRE